MIKLKDILIETKILKENAQEINALMQVLSDRPDLVQTAISATEYSDKPINENILKSPRILRKIAAMLLAAGISANDLSADDDIQSKIHSIFSKEKSGQTPPVRFVMPPSSNVYDKNHAYNKGASDKVPAPYNQNVKKREIDANKIVFNDEFINKLADAIYRAEGGAKSKSPYGVLSIKLKGATPEAKKEEARKITITSIKNNWNRWLKTDKSKNFIDFMADRWCPISADPVGNKNWKNNVKRIMGMPTK